MDRLTPTARSWYPRDKVALRSDSVPVRVVQDQPDPTIVRRSVGFTATLIPADPDTPEESEPLVWDGDQA